MFTRLTITTEHHAVHLQHVSLLLAYIIHFVKDTGVTEPATPDTQ